MKGYAESQTVIPEIDDTYMGWAVHGDDDEIDIDGKISAAGIVIATDVLAVILPFCISCLIIVIIYHLPPNVLEKWMKTLEQSSEAQGTILALILLSILITVYIIVMDIMSTFQEIHSFVPWITVAFHFILDFFAIFWMVSSGILIYRFYRSKPGKSQSLAEALTLCFSAPFFQFICHIPSILLAWSSDPFYASKIVVYYAIFIFANYVTVKYTYILSLTVLDQLDKNQHSHFQNAERRCCRVPKFVSGILKQCFLFPKITSMIISFVAVIFVNGALVTLAIFFGSIPVYTNTSIESSASAIAAILTGGVIIIGLIITYNVVWHYLFKSFSIQAVLKRAMKEMGSPSNVDDDSNWDSLTEEGRMVQVLKALIQRQTALPGPGKSAAEPLELTEIKAQ